MENVAFDATKNVFVCVLVSGFVELDMHMYVHDMHMYVHDMHVYVHV